MGKQLDLPPIIPVAVIDDAEAAEPLARALAEGGLPVIEVTFRTDAAADAIRRVRERAPDVLAGAGTVITPQQADEAIAAGAQFAVAPGTNPDIVARFQAAGIPFMPGVATPSDIERAYALGVRRMKFFPAGALGGIAALKAIAAPYAHVGVSFCPTGGVSLDNLADYLALSQVFAVGGSWVAKREEIARGDWRAITEKAAAAMAVAAGR